ncbi:MAG TPA: choice-of-anchor Q domain-containing protein [Solirubrobacterales bacterium]|nr:choice-of-anchor Q domain-containing protein [Solirubrobacterales bacterium]
MAKRQRRRRQERRKEHARREGWRTRHSVITGVGVTAGAVVGLSAPALAATYTVTNTSDLGNGVCDSSCTLREAVEYANTDPNTTDDIVFASGLSGTITLTEQIVITGAVDIHGPGASTLTVSGDNNSRIFGLYMDYNADEVRIEGLTLANGSEALGGAILDVNAELYLTESVLTGNEAYAGGALYEAGQTGDEGRYTLVTFSTLSHNTAQYAGAIGSRYSWGLIGASTLYDNTAYGLGGAITTYLNAGGSVFDSTVSGNDAYATGGLLAYYAFTANSIFANNTAAPGNATDVYSANLYADFDLVENPGVTTLIGSSNITGTDPQLGGLANNGGPTPTLRQAARSPVVDQGSSYPNVDVDQRFSGRPVDITDVPNAPGGNGADIGALELTQSEAAVPSPPAPVAPTKKKKCKKKKKKNHAASAKKKKCKKKKKKKRSTVAARASVPRAINAWQARAERRPRHGLQPAGHTRTSGRADWADQAWWTNR